MAEPRRIWDYLTKRSERMERDEQEVIGKSRAYLEWIGMPYFPLYMNWLHKQANAPVKASPDHMDMVVGATRANTFREIIQYLENEKSRAHMALGDENV